MDETPTYLYFDCSRVRSAPETLSTGKLDHRTKVRFWPSAVIVAEAASGPKRLYDLL